MLAAPSTDPGVRHYRTRLLACVLTASITDGSFGGLPYLPHPAQARSALCPIRPALCPEHGGLWQVPLEPLAALQAEDLEADVAPAGGLGGDVDEASVRTRR